MDRRSKDKANDPIDLKPPTDPPIDPIDPKPPTDPTTEAIPNDDQTTCLRLQRFSCWWSARAIAEYMKKKNSTLTLMRPILTTDSTVELMPPPDPPKDPIESKPLTDQP